MESGIKRTQRDYTLAFKLAVVEQIEKGELTYKQAQQRYGIQGRSTVLVWLRKHGRLGWSPAASSAAMPLDNTKGPLTPEQQIMLDDLKTQAQSLLQKGGTEAATKAVGDLFKPKSN